MVLWLAITPLAVLVHELGHALVAKTTGAHPQIALAGFGGVTMYTPPGPVSRARSLCISLAGPGVGLVVGAGLVVVRLAVADSLVRGTWQDFALTIGIWTCIGWSVLNLLPVLPLDGGQAMRELLPGSPQVRHERAAGVSVVVASICAVVAYSVYDEPFLALFMLFFAITNGLTVRDALRPRSQAAQDAPPGGLGGEPVTGREDGAAERAIVALLWQGDTAKAREVLASQPPGTSVDLVVHGAVLALTGDRAQGHALIDQEVARRPGDLNTVALLMLTYTLEHDWDGVVATMQGPLGRSVPPAVVTRAIDEARAAEREDVAGRLALLAEPPVL
jgi:Zn-dependent protease